MAKTLGDRLLEVLAEGGPRKPHILRSLAEHLGLGAQFDPTIEALKRAQRIRVLYRYGGPHYALKTRTRAA